MRDRCDVVVYVRSRRRAIEVRQVRVPVAVPFGTGVTTVHETRRFVRTARVLDMAHANVVAEARWLAAIRGHPLRVVDLGRAHPVLRVLRSLLLRSADLPVVVWRGPCFGTPLRPSDEQFPMTGQRG